jgi:hypothetical protein
MNVGERIFSAVPWLFMFVLLGMFAILGPMNTGCEPAKIRPHELSQDVVEVVHGEFGTSIYRWVDKEAGVVIYTQAVLRGTAMAAIPLRDTLLPH